MQRTNWETNNHAKKNWKTAVYTKKELRNTWSCKKRTKKQLCEERTEKHTNMQEYARNKKHKITQKRTKKQYAKKELDQVNSANLVLNSDLCFFLF